MSNNRDFPCKTTIYLLRHGDSRQDDVKRYIGQADLPLNGSGRAQAAGWQQELAAVPMQRIFSSDLSRSFETACIVAEGRTEPVQPLARLREINLGGWDGRSMDEVRLFNPFEYEKRGADMVYYRPPGGECFADVAARVIPLFEELVRGVQGNVLIVGHAGVNKVILCHILGMPLANLFRMRQDYGCLNVIDCGRDGMRLRGMNMGSPAGDVVWGHTLFSHGGNCG
jgi:alpha-ribazole phosphatase